MKSHSNQPVPTLYSYRVADGLYASEYPINKEDVARSDKLNGMIEFGITDFIDLTYPGDRLHPYKQFLPEGIGHWSFPIVDCRAPSSPEFMDEIVAKINELLALKRTICVHCWGGIGRTGTVVTAWLGKTFGYNYDKALSIQQQLWEANPKSQRTYESITQPQRRFLMEYLARD